MVLVINSPNIIWSILTRTIYNFTNHNPKAQNFIATTWQMIIQVFQHGPFIFECASKYASMLIFTLMCLLINAALQMLWLPIVGLLWWFNFYKNLINNPTGWPLCEIWRSPDSGNPISVGATWLRHGVKRCRENDYRFQKMKLPFLAPRFPFENNSKRRHPKPFQKQFPGIKPSASLPTCYLPIDHRENQKKINYFNMKMPIMPLLPAINVFLFHIWNVHSNAEFYHNVNMIFLSLWLCLGHQLCKLAFHIFDRWKEQLKKKLVSFCLPKPKPGTLWTYIK